MNLNPNTERKIISIERQMLLFNMALAGIHSAPDTLKDTDEFRSVLNQIEKYRKELKRKLAVEQKKLM